MTDIRKASKKYYLTLKTVIFPGDYFESLYYCRHVL